MISDGSILGLDWAGWRQFFISTRYALGISLQVVSDLDVSAAEAFEIRNSVKLNQF